jgi:hypothetical protein
METGERRRFHTLDTRTVKLLRWVGRGNSAACEGSRWCGCGVGAGTMPAPSLPACPSSPHTASSTSAMMGQSTGERVLLL